MYPRNIALVLRTLLRNHKDKFETDIQAPVTKIVATQNRFVNQWLVNTLNISDPTVIKVPRWSNISVVIATQSVKYISYDYFSNVAK